ncbi:hypothetical protein [Metabacillus litoralis]|uniref:hypothetical protein n=1 Tax=Metabacillus litoralis TaxID=152268 RepID=UPI00203BF208|nr:hypothetical protein [Metabacillus litoralis]
MKFCLETEGNRDRKSSKEDECVSKERESGQKELQRGGICLETGGIGTEPAIKSQNVSRNRGNWDRTSSKESKCVSKQRESGQKELQRVEMCLETEGIGTERAPKS